MTTSALIGSQAFWITSRAAGIVALILASASVGVGVSISGRLVKGRGPDLRVTHEALSLAALRGASCCTPPRCSATATSIRASRR